MPNLAYTALIFMSILLPLSAYAGIGDLDSDGWTQLSPSTDSRVVYVSNSGNDAFDGLSESSAKRTIDAANALMRDGYPDWMRLRRGDTFAQPNLGRWKSGRNRNEPMVMTTYGTDGDRPIIELTTELVNWAAQARSHIAFVGLDLYRAISDPGSPDFANLGSASAFRFVTGTNTASNVLVEDCKIRFSWIIVRGQGANDVLENFHLRRSTIQNSWAHGSTDSHDGRVQGIFIYGTRNVYLEENLFDHNGWNASIPDANANMYNHNVYMATNNDGEIVVRGNIFSRGSAHGLQLRSGGTAEMNAFVGNAIGMNMGYNTPPVYFNAQTLVRQNVVTDGRPQVPNDTSNPQTGAIWGLWLQSIQNISISDNIVANIEDTRGGNMRPYNGLSPNDFGTENIAHSWYQNSFPLSPPTYTDAGRNASSYAAANGLGSWEDVIAIAANRPLHTMPYIFSAYSYLDYIREGFNRGAVNPPYNLGGEQNPEPEPTGENVFLGQDFEFSAFQGPYTMINDGDASPNRRWTANGNVHFAEVDLGQRYTFSEFRLFAYQNRDYQYVVEVSEDGQNYTVAVDRSNNTEQNEFLANTVSASGRYVRLRVLGAATYTGPWTSIREFEGYGVVAEEPPVTPPTELLSYGEMPSEGFDDMPSPYILGQNAEDIWLGRAGACNQCSRIQSDGDTYLAAGYGGSNGAFQVIAWPQTNTVSLSLNSRNAAAWGQPTVTVFGGYTGDTISKFGTPNTLTTVEVYEVERSDDFESRTFEVDLSTHPSYDFLVLRLYNGQFDEFSLVESDE